jgi:mannose/fructose-specific phosphotransferase system component IIA
MVTGIVVAHGNLAEELLRTARGVYGDFSDCYALSNASKSTQSLAKEIDSVIDALDGAPCVIFVDFLGGSCGHACVIHAREWASRVQIISGVNLPMFLAFLNKRDEVSFEALAEVILERSHDSIKTLDPSKT